MKWTETIDDKCRFVKGVPSPNELPSQRVRHSLSYLAERANYERMGYIMGLDRLPIQWELYPHHQDMIAKYCRPSGRY